MSRCVPMHDPSGVNLRCSMSRTVTNREVELPDHLSDVLAFVCSRVVHRLSAKKPLLLDISTSARRSADFLLLVLLPAHARDRSRTIHVPGKST